MGSRYPNLHDRPRLEILPRDSDEDPFEAPAGVAPSGPLGGEALQGLLVDIGALLGA